MRTLTYTMRIARTDEYDKYVILWTIQHKNANSALCLTVLEEI